MIGRLLTGFLASNFALPATGVAALALIYFLLVLYCMLGRLRLYRRPLDAPLITDDGPAIGESLPAAVMEALTRKLAPPAGWGSGRRIALLFAAPGCAPCLDLLPQIAPVARKWHRDTRVVVILDTAGITREHPAMRPWFRIPVPLISDETGEISAGLGIRHRPLALLIDPLGAVLMKGIVSSGAHLNALMEEWGVPQGGRLWAPTQLVGDAV